MCVREREGERDSVCVVRESVHDCMHACVCMCVNERERDCA